MLWDCFTFFNELDVLELRLEELSHVVDRFVLVEATRTFSNRPKPLVFAENRERFARFLPRIVHVVVDDMPERPRDTWELEAFQRNAILRGLGGARPDDLVLLSDVDEIPRASVVERLDEGGYVLLQDLFYFKLNCKNVRGETREALTAVVRRRDLGLPQHARQHRFVLEPIPDAGWHFSYLGDAGAVRTKIEAYAHQELNRPEVTDLARLSDRIAAAQDPFDREGYEWRYVPLDASFPRHLLANPQRFARHLGAVPAVIS